MRTSMAANTKIGNVMLLLHSKFQLTLKAVAVLSLLTDHVEDGVDQLSSLSIVTFGPVVSSTRLAEHEVVWSEDLSEGTGADTVNHAGLEVLQHKVADVSKLMPFRRTPSQEMFLPLHSVHQIVLHASP